MTRQTCLLKTSVFPLLICISFVWFGVDVNADQEGAEQMDLLQFIQQEGQRKLTNIPRKVLAFYYTWYGNLDFHDNWIHWGKVDADKHDIQESTHYPEKGAYDSHDPAIIDYHIDLAKSCGIDGFITTWWGQGRYDDQVLGSVLDHAAERDFSVTIYWETAPGEGEAQINHAVDDLLYVLQKYGSRPGFLKVDDQPVIFVYGRVMNQVPMDAWPTIITRTRHEYGGDFFLIADGYRESYTRLFAGIHTYNICGWVQGKQPEELEQASGSSFRQAVGMAKSRDRLSCITIIPGYDDTKIRTPGINAERLRGDTYRILWEQAIGADPDWVLITSWNEWHEGSEIEPSFEYGDQYIRMTAEHSKQFKQTRHSSVQKDSSPGLTSEQALALRDMYQGRKIGILPDFSSSVVFWLADTGIDLELLSWEDVANLENLRPERLPIVLYAAHEEYTQSVNSTGDVDEGILTYQRAGGILMSVSSGPFPFYYNEQRQAVASAGRFGFPIGGGGPDSHVRSWEMPPEDISLTFQIDTQLLGGLPSSVPFPDSGDLRWRPCTDELLAEEDTYLPMARLVDGEGNVYGDGIAYIHHQVSEPKNGGNIYVWMGMTEILDADDLFYALFTLLLKS